MRRQSGDVSEVVDRDDVREERGGWYGGFGRSEWLVGFAVWW